MDMPCIGEEGTIGVSTSSEFEYNAFLNNYDFQL